ncbi:hypothetical protein AVEN_179457-1 [Araneus ventricosus]|uniref:Uncharacterized protein n=1 Tax=Araneus ventricosus TaxID=182803 RepID=A0A4Y2BE98_ARAVE|nr:hypothetical protein AVEN_179457-1 [Araneus ventricosus]
MASVAPGTDLGLSCDIPGDSSITYIQMKRRHKLQIRWGGGKTKGENENEEAFMYEAKHFFESKTQNIVVPHLATNLSRTQTNNLGAFYPVSPLLHPSEGGGDRICVFKYISER